MKRLGVLSAMVLGLVACSNGDKDVETYRLAKDEAENGNTQLAGWGQDLSQAASEYKLEWDLPEGWVEETPSGMRVGSFKVHGPDGELADVSVTMLPGDGGGDLANVNRWRDQLGLDAWTEQEFSSNSRAVSNSLGNGRAVNMVSEAPEDRQRIIGSVVHTEYGACFVKMKGDDVLTAEQEDNLIKFVEKLRTAE